MTASPTQWPRLTALALLLGTLFFMGASLTPARAADAAPEDTALKVIDRVSHDVLAILADKNMPPLDKRRKIQDIAYTNIDFDALARLALGRAWRDLDDTQRADFTKEYRTHLANTYRNMIDNYTDEEIKMVGDREEARGDRTVLTKVIDPKNNEEFKVDYRMRKTKDTWRIIDITIEGVSLAANFRAQFQEIMDKGGFDRVMKTLRDKNAAADREPAKK